MGANMFHFVDLNVMNPMFGYITMVFHMDALMGTLLCGNAPTNQDSAYSHRSISNLSILLGGSVYPLRVIWVELSCMAQVKIYS